MGRALRSTMVAVPLFAALAGGALLVLPAYIKQQAIDMAARQGVHLTIDKVELGWSTITLNGLGFTLSDLPGVHATLATATITRNGLAVDHVTAQGLDLTLQGSGDTLLEGLASPHGGAAASGGGASSGPPPPPVEIVSGRVLWLAPMGATSSVEAMSIHVELPTGPGGDVHATLGRVNAALAPGKELGPWTARLDHTSHDTTFTLELVPDAPGAATVRRTLAVSNGATPDSRAWDAALHGQKLSRTGIPGSLLGIPTSVDPSVDLTFHQSDAGNTEDGALALSLRGARFASMTMPADVKLDLAWAGDPSKPVPVKRGTFAIGPFGGDVTGTMGPMSDAARVDLALKSRPVSCAILAGAQAEASGPIGGLAVAAGLTRAVAGDVVLEGVLVLDTSAPAKTRAELTPKSNCSISLLP